VSSIQSITFDQPSYTPGQVITLTVDYTPDAATGGGTPQVFTATVVITSPAGVQTASQSAPFTVTTGGASGDVVSVTDDGGRTWVQTSDSGTVAVFTTTA
jgi:hypothetical protein